MHTHFSHLCEVEDLGHWAAGLLYRREAEASPLPHWIVLSTEGKLKHPPCLIESSCLQKGSWSSFPASLHPLAAKLLTFSTFTQDSWRNWRWHSFNIQQGKIARCFWGQLASDSNSHPHTDIIKQFLCWRLFPFLAGDSLLCNSERLVLGRVWDPARQCSICGSFLHKQGFSAAGEGLYCGFQQVACITARSKPVIPASCLLT